MGSALPANQGTGIKVAPFHENEKCQREDQVNWVVLLQLRNPQCGFYESPSHRIYYCGAFSGSFRAGSPLVVVIVQPLI